MTPNRCRTATLALMAAALWLGACAGVPLSSYSKLMRLDPMTANPQDILIATRLHETVQTDTLQVTMLLNFEDEAAQMAEYHEFEVETSPAQFLTPALADGLAPGDRTTILRLTPADAQTLQGFQQRVREHRANGGEGEGEFTISVRGFCFASPDAIEDQDLTIFLKTDPQGDFFVFLRRELTDLVDEADLARMAEARCGEEAGLQ